MWNVPHGHLRHDIILHLELLHLPVAHRTVLALEEVLLDFVPRALVLPPERYLHSAVITQSTPANLTEVRDALAASERDEPREIAPRGAAFIPHTEEELRCERMDLVEIEEERLEGR